MLSTALETEVDFLRSSNPGFAIERLQSFEIARTRAALVVHPSDPIRRMPLNGTRKILTALPAVVGSILVVLRLRAAFAPTVTPLGHGVAGFIVRLSRGLAGGIGLLLDDGHSRAHGG